MVININGYGRLGNHLLHFSSFIANSLEYNYKLVYYGFDSYRMYFPFFESSNFNMFYPNLPYDESNGKLVNKIAKRLLFYIIRNYKNLKSVFKFMYCYEITHTLLKETDIGFDINQSTFLKHANRGIVFINGWRFNDFNNMDKHKMFIKTIWNKICYENLKPEKN